MTTLTVNIDNKKSEKAVKAVLDALGVSYDVYGNPDSVQKTYMSAHNFLGKVSKEDIALMEEAIKEGCEQIHPDDWK